MKFVMLACALNWSRTVKPRVAVPPREPPIGQAKAEAERKLKMLAPEESAKYSLCFEAFEI